MGDRHISHKFKEKVLLCYPPCAWSRDDGTDRATGLWKQHGKKN